MNHKDINNNSHTKIRNVCSSEDAVKKKLYTMDRQKMLTKHISDKRLVSK